MKLDFRTMFFLIIPISCFTLIAISDLFFPYNILVTTISLCVLISSVIIVLYFNYKWKDRYDDHHDIQIAEIGKIVFHKNYMFISPSPIENNQCVKLAEVEGEYNLLAQMKVYKNNEEVLDKIILNKPNIEGKVEVNDGEILLESGQVIILNDKEKMGNSLERNINENEKLHYNRQFCHLLNDGEHTFGFVANCPEGSGVYHYQYKKLNGLIISVDISTTLPDNEM